MNRSRSRPLPLVAVVFTLVVVIYAIRLLVPAILLVASARAAAEFAAKGLPDATRWAIAVPEMLGAVLLSIPASYALGCGILVADLTGAILVHVHVGERPVTLLALLAALLLLTLIRWLLHRTRRTA